MLKFLGLRTLRARIIAGGIAAQMLLAFALLAGFSYVTQISLADSLQASARQTAESLNLTVSPYLSQGNAGALNEFFQEMLRDPDGNIAYIGIRDANRKVLVRAGQLPEGDWPAPSASVSEAIASGAYHLRQPVLLERNSVGELQFALRTDFVDRLKSRAVFVTLAVSLMASLIAAALLVVLSRSFNRRLKNLVETSEFLAAGDYSARADATGDDELHVLARQFNSMAARIAQQVNSLKESREVFFGIFNGALVPMSFSTLRDGRYALDEVNLAWQERFQIKREAALGKDGLQLQLYREPEKRSALVEQAMRKRFASGELWLQRADGEALLCLVALTRLDLSDGVHMVFAATDITELRRSQEALQELNIGLEQKVAERTSELAERNESLSDALKSLQNAQEVIVQSEKLASLGSMVAAVAHELNTPIGNARTVGSALLDRSRGFESGMQSGLRRSELESFVRYAIDVCELLDRNLDKAADLIRSFKEVAVDRTSSQRRIFDLKTVIDEVMLTLLPTFRHAPVAFEVAATEGIKCDSYPGPLGQVLVNLVNNAVTHGLSDRPEGGSIKVFAEAAEAGWARIVVEDNGVGIPPQNLKRVFDPFFTTRLGQGGSGLGLNITHNIVTGLLGGRILVDSQIGVGSVFTVIFPLEAPRLAEGEGDVINVYGGGQ